MLHATHCMPLCSFLIQFYICQSVFCFVFFLALFVFSSLALLNSSWNALRFWLSPSDACTARFETSEVTEFAFSRTAPGWVTSLLAAPIQREHQNERAQERKRTSVCVCVEKNQLLFTTLQAARGNSAGTEGGAKHMQRAREWESAGVTAEQQWKRESVCERECRC